MKIKTECAYDKMVPIGKVKPNPKNPNRHPDRQIEMLALLIQHFGWRGPITVSNLSGLVVRGHGRLMAARKLKLRTVPVDFQDYENEIEELADLLDDNKISELSYLDDEKVRALFQNIDSDLEFTAFDADEIDRLMKDHTGFLAGADPAGGDVDQSGEDTSGGADDDDDPPPEVVQYYRLPWEFLIAERDLIIRAVNRAKEDFKTDTTSQALIAMVSQAVEG